MASQNDDPHGSMGLEEPMKITLATMALSRMEWPFIGNWIRHHASLGVSEFLIFNDGARARDIRDGGDGTEKRWHAKPWANYWDDLSDEAVNNLFETEAVNAGIAAEVTNTVFALDFSEPGDAWQVPRQLRAFAKAAKLAEEADWFGFFDVDEYLFAYDRDLSGVLKAVQGRYESVQIAQRIFEKRWDIEKRVRFPEHIVGHFGDVGFGGKFLSRGGSVLQTGNIHSPAPPVPSFSFSPEVLRIDHYRGAEGSARWTSLREWKQRTAPDPDEPLTWQDHRGHQ